MLSALQLGFACGYGWQFCLLCKCCGQQDMHACVCRPAFHCTSEFKLMQCLHTHSFSSAQLPAGSVTPRQHCQVRLHINLCKRLQHQQALQQQEPGQLVVSRVFGNNNSSGSSTAEAITIQQQQQRRQQQCTAISNRPGKVAAARWLQLPTPSITQQQSAAAATLVMGPTAAAAAAAAIPTSTLAASPQTETGNGRGGGNGSSNNNNNGDGGGLQRLHQSPDCSRLCHWAGRWRVL